MEKFNFKNNIGQENTLLQIEIYKFTNLLTFAIFKNTHL